MSNSANGINKKKGNLYSAAGLDVDFSRTPLAEILSTYEANGQLVARAEALQAAIQAMLQGDIINKTEQRPVMHVALRDIQQPSTSFAKEAQPVFQRIVDTAERIRRGDWKGSTGKRITSIINIGIGGSDLGPRLACDALKSPDGSAGAIDTHFVANIDPVELNDAIAQCDPETTLVILASKTFTTLETLENGNAAKRWLLSRLAESDLSRHLLAVTANPAKAEAYGVAGENIFPFWDWVGGRYSMWSAIGLSIAITHGGEQFTQLLKGANAMDAHFASAPIEKNLPALLALLEDHYVNALNVHSVAVLPYSHRLRLLPDYLQQLCMESNGKRVTEEGDAVVGRTCPVIWGCAGTVGQHSFYQLLHQGTELIPADFILPLSPGSGTNAESSDDDQRSLHLAANCLAQSKAMYEGKSVEQARQESLAAGNDEQQSDYLAKHREVPGGKPNTIIAMPSVDACSLGALIALYEHKIFALSIFWQINAFDQWGVELGKQLSKPIFDSLVASSDEGETGDSTTQYWVERLRTAKK